MAKVKAYLANQLGFSSLERFIHMEIRPALSVMNVEILDPFKECSKFLDLNYLHTLQTHNEVVEYWKDFSKKVTPTNNALMEKSDMLLAILDGGHTVDDGVASEIGYYAGIKRGPIFAVRSDFRLGENIGCPINPQIFGYIIQSGGKLSVGPAAYADWYKDISEFCSRFS